MDIYTFNKDWASHLRHALAGTWGKKEPVVTVYIAWSQGMASVDTVEAEVQGIVERYHDPSATNLEIIVERDEPRLDASCPRRSNYVDLVHYLHVREQ